MQKNNYFLAISLCFLFFQGFSQATHKHNHSNSNEPNPFERQKYIEQKLKSIQLVFDKDSLAGFNEEVAWQKILRGEPENYEKIMKLSYTKRKYINDKYNLVKKISPPKIEQVQAACTNMGFENGNTTGWTITEGDNVNSVTHTVLNNAWNVSTTRFKVVGPGTDPIVPVLQTVPSQAGNFSLLLGDLPVQSNNNLGGYAVKAKQTFSVTESNSVFIYRYAVVLEAAQDLNGSSVVHTCTSQPYFNISFTNSNNQQIPCTDFNVVAGSPLCTTGTDPSFIKYSNTDYYYKDWVTKSFDLRPYIGQSVSIEFIASDCDQSAHFGWAYIDCSCQSMALSLNGNELPYDPQTIKSMCSMTTNTLCAPAGFTSYSWSQSGGGGITGQTGQCINVTNPATYSVTLGMQGVSCNSPILYSTFSLVPAPSANFNYTATSCQSSLVVPFTSSVNLNGGTPISSYAWDFNNDGITDNSTANPTFTFSDYGTHIAQFSASNGACSATATKTISIQPAPTVDILGNSNCSLSCVPLTGQLTGYTSSIKTPSFSASPNLSISSSGTVAITSTISVSGLSSATLTSVRININHDSDNDLDIYLICPDGTTLELSTDNGSSGKNYVDTYFTTTATNVIGTSGNNTAPFTGTYKPEGGSLDILNSCSLNGNWVLRIIDDNGGDGGNLNNWTLQFNNIDSSPITSYSWSPAVPSYTYSYTQLSSTSISPSFSAAPNASISIPNTSTTTSSISVSGLNSATLTSVCLNIDHTYDGDLSIYLICPSGNTLTLSAKNGGGDDNYRNTCFSIGATNAIGSSGNNSGPFSNTYKPEGGSLTTFSNCASNGNWILKVVDDVGGDGGVLKDWKLTFIDYQMETLIGTVNPISSSSWTPNSNGNAILSPTVCPSSITAYTLTATSSNGCSATDVITVGPATTASISASTLTIGCGNTSKTATVTSTPTSDVIYSWSPAPASGGNGTVATFTNAGTYKCSVTNTLTNCTATVQVIVSNTANTPTTTASVTGTLTCSTPTVILNSTLAGMTYTWSAPSTGTVTNANAQNAIANGIGTYTLAITNPTSNCTYTTTTSVTQNTTVPITTASVTGSLTCSTLTVQLNSTLAEMSYTWTSPSGSLTNGNSQNAITNASGVHTLAVINPTNGCVYTTTISVPQNTNQPTVNAGLTKTLTCVSPSVSLTGTVSPTNTNVKWTGANVCIGTNSITASVCSAGIYTLTATHPTNGCVASSTVEIVSDAAIPTVTIIPVTNSITCTNTLVTVSITSTSTPITYTWSGTGIVSGSSTSTISVTKGGIFTYTVTDNNSGCKTTGSQTVPQYTISPIVSAGSSKTITCSTSSVSLTGTVSPAGASLNWTGGTICGTTTLQTTSVCAASIYSLTATDPVNGCISSSTVQVFADGAIPTVTLIPTNTITCTNTLVTVGLTSTVTANTYTYTWSGSGIVSATNTNTISVNKDGVYNYTVTSGNGCAKTSTVQVVEDRTIPTATLILTNTITCTNTLVTIGITSTVNPVSYNWVANANTGIVSANTNTNSISVNKDGVYNYTITNTNNGCSKTATVQVVEDKATPTVTLIPTNTITCTNTLVTVGVTTTISSVAYNWSGNGIVAGAPTNTVTVNKGGVYTYTVTNTSNGCAKSGTLEVSQNTVTPTVSVSTNGTITCSNPTVTLNAVSNSTVNTYVWKNPSGTTLANTQNTTANVSGTHILVVVDPINGCSSTNTVNVIENKQKPDPTFNIDPAKGTAPLVVNFSPNATQASNTFAWNFGDSNNNTSILTTPNHTYNDLGSYVISLVVTNNASQCKDSTQLTVLVYENSSIVIPNVFTPNGDGANDSFKIHTVGINELTCEIYNRWGTKLYTISGPNDSWDGAENSAGTYFFILNAKGIDGKEYNEKGFLTMFK